MRTAWRNAKIRRSANFILFDCKYTNTGRFGMNYNVILENEKLHRKHIGKKARMSIMLCLLACSMMFLLQLGISYLFLWLYPYLPFEITDTVSYIIDAVFYILYLILPFGTVSLIFKKSKFNSENHIVKRTSPKAPPLYIFGSIGIGYLINLSINILFPNFVEFFNVDSGITANTPVDIIFCYVLYAILPAILEEWAFRGVLLKNLLPYGKGGAIIVTSVLFGIAHIDPPRIIFATAFGMMLAVCYEYTGSLKIPMLIHFINNAISVTLSLLPTDSTLSLLFSQLVLGLMGCGIAAIIYYSNKGIKRKVISLDKPASIGYKLPIVSFVKEALLNYGIIPYAALYVVFFVMYYII